MRLLICMLGGALAFPAAAQVAGVGYGGGVGTAVPRTATAGIGAGQGQFGQNAGGFGNGTITGVTRLTPMTYPASFAASFFASGGVDLQVPAVAMGNANSGTGGAYGQAALVQGSPPARVVAPSRFAQPRTLAARNRLAVIQARQAVAAARQRAAQPRYAKLIPVEGPEPAADLEPDRSAAANDPKVAD